MTSRACFACLVVALHVASAWAGDGEALPAGALRRLGTARLRHPGVTELRFIRDGKALLSAGIDGTTRLWEASTGRELGRFAGSAFCLSHDEKRLATAGDAVRVWDLGTGKELAGSPLDRDAWSPIGCQLAFTRDGRALVSLLQFERPAGIGPAGGRVRTWDLATGKRTHERTLDPSHGYLMLSPDAKTVVENDGGTGYKLHDAATGKLLRDWPFTAYGRSIFAPDGQTVVGLTFDPRENAAQGGTLVGRDVRTGKDRFRIRTTSNLWAWFFAPDGKQLATGPGHLGTYSAVAPEKKTLLIVDTATGKVRHELPVGAQGYQGVAFSRDGKRLAVSGWAGEGIRIWDLETGQRIRDIPRSVAQHSPFNLSPDGTVLALGRGACIELWETATGKRLVPQQAHELAPVALGFSADGKRLASIDAEGATHVWDPETGRQLEQHAPPPRGGPQHYYPFEMPTLIFTPAGKVQAVGMSGSRWSTSDGRYSHSMVHQVDLATGKRVRWFGDDQAPISAFTVAADGKTLAGTIGRRVHLWDLATGRQRAAFAWQDEMPKKEAARLVGPPVVALALAPDGRTIATGVVVSFAVANQRGDTALTLWETATGKARYGVREPGALLDTSGDGTVLLIAPDGRALVLAHGDTLRLWDVVDQREVHRFGGRIQAGTAALSPDGRLLAAASTDGGVALWDMVTGAALPVIKTASRLTCFRFAPDSRALATGGEDTAILLWDLDRLSAARPAAISEGDFAALWNELAGADAGRAGRAMATLTRGSADSVAHLRRVLHPIAPAAADRLRRLRADLDSDDFVVRDRAGRELEALGDLALPVLTLRDGDRPTLEARRRVTALLDKLTTAPPTAEVLRALRAIETLEHIGTPDARAVLETMATGSPEHRVTLAAREASARLRLRPRRDPITPAAFRPPESHMRP